LNLSVGVAPEIAKIGTRADGTNKKIFEVIRGMGPIDLSLDKMELPPLQRAIFYDHWSTTAFKWILNLTKLQLHKWRKVLYKDLVPRNMLSNITGHCWNHYHIFQVTSPINSPEACQILAYLVW
jgi:hypothetical protein